MLLFDSMARVYILMGETLFHIEDKAMDRFVRIQVRLLLPYTARTSCCLQITDIYVAAEGIALFAVNYRLGKVADDDEEGLKVICNSESITLLLKPLELNAKRCAWQHGLSRRLEAFLSPTIRPD